MELKPEDLRIGNHVHESSYDECYHIYAVRQLKTDGCTVSVLGGIIQGMYDYKDLKGIPITEDILLRLGSIKPKPSYSIIIYDRFRLKWLDSYKYWYVTDLNSFTYLTKIEYLHEWQNFVKAMNNEELKLKEQ